MWNTELTAVQKSNKIYYEATCKVRWALKG